MSEVTLYRCSPGATGAQAQARAVFWGSAFRVSCFVLRVSFFVFLVSGLVCRVSFSGFRDSGFGIRVSGFVFRVSCVGFRFQGFGLRVWGLGNLLDVEVLSHPPARCLHLFTGEVKSCRPLNFTDSKTQPFHESSPSPWQQRSPSLSRGRCPPLRRS